MTTDFPTLIGKFIHHCGVLEFFTNNSIRAYARDPLLSADAIKSSFYKRIILLRQLLYDRSDIKKNDIDFLCDKLDEIRIERNIIAHNPIFSTMPNGSGTEEILVLRYKPTGVDSPYTITKKEIATMKVVQQASRLKWKATKLCCL